MIRQLIIRKNENKIIKPLGFNESVFIINVHYLPRIENLSGGVIECIGDECVICKIYNYLNDNKLFNKIKRKFKQNGYHFNIKKNKLIIIPTYYFFNNKWILNYLKLFESQFIIFYNFLKENNLFHIGDPLNSETISVFIDDYNNLVFSKNKTEFVINPIQLNNDYKKFINFISDLNNLNIICDSENINFIVQQFSLYLKQIYKNLKK